MDPTLPWGAYKTRSCSVAMVLVSTRNMRQGLPRCVSLFNRTLEKREWTESSLLLLVLALLMKLGRSEGHGEYLASDV